MIEALVKLYRAVDHGEFEAVTDQVAKLSGQPPESVEDFLAQALGG